MGGAAAGPHCRVHRHLFACVHVELARVLLAEAGQLVFGLDEAVLQQKCASPLVLILIRMQQEVLALLHVFGLELTADEEERQVDGSIGIALTMRLFVILYS